MKQFKPYDPDQDFLLPPSPRDWLPEKHLAYVLRDVVGELDLSAIYRAYEHADDRGQPPYDPALMVTLLLYGYCVGVPSSRRIERATWDDVGFRVLAADAHPDHDSLAAFRQRHLSALAALFVQVLQLCRKAGLVKLGHVALDGTKVQANASKHKAMSYGRMGEAEAKLQAEVDALLAEAAQVDAAEDAQYGQGRQADELPEELRRREPRLAKIRAAKAALEAEARAAAAAKAAEVQERLAERARIEEERGRKFGGRPPAAPDPEKAAPDPKAQKNFTDPDSRIMLDGATKGFVQAYNAQAAVDGDAQVIVACAVTQQANDKAQLAPMAQEIEKNLGEKPAQLSADAGYGSEDNLTAAAVQGIDLYVPPEREKKLPSVAEPPAPLPAEETRQTAAAPQPVPAPSTAEATKTAEMRAKLRTPAGRAVYARRKGIVEPVFGQIKEARGFRRFLLRGLTQVAAEWALICMTHNILKLYRQRYAEKANNEGK